MHRPLPSLAARAVLLLPLLQAVHAAPAPLDAPLDAQVDASAEHAPSATGCPGGLPAGTRCLAGQDRLGSHYLVAVPPDWNGTLVLHAHGGPLLGEPRP